MILEICRMVSNTFYDGKLKVASTCNSDRSWLDERRPFPVTSLGSRNAYLVRTPFESRFSTRHGGHIRHETAELVTALVHDLVNAIDQTDILVLTPYRAQRTLLRAALKNAGYKRVLVSTVHRAQGSERNTVIFDPVHASTSFLNNRDLGPRLMNVALSRAKARLFVIASRENLLNPVIRQIAGILTGGDDTAPVALSKSPSVSAYGCYTKSGGRLYSRDDLVGAAAHWKRQGKTVVFTNGCYDLLHPGHIRLLEQARSLGDVLILALNSDASVRRLKGPSRPLIAEGERAEMAAGARGGRRGHPVRRRYAARADRRRAARCPGEGRRLVALHRRPRRSGSRRRQRDRPSALEPGYSTTNIVERMSHASLDSSCRSRSVPRPGTPSRLSGRCCAASAPAATRSALRA